MKKLVKSALLVSLVASCVLTVAACGKKGDVKPPPSYSSSN
ncbi:hypothetical protein [Kordiimonas aestuarii]|nr:hypothetical protein [Kordiimonas aestuarii]